MTQGEERAIIGPFSFDGMVEMYICLCNAIKQSQIEDAIREGAITLEALQEKLEVAMNCGACETEIIEILNRFTGGTSNPLV